MAKKKLDIDKLFISQSMVKGLYKYLYKNECGHYFENIYLTKKFRTSPSDVMKYGHFFEFEATGQKPAHGDPVPEPELLLRNSGENKRGDLKEAWRIAKEQAELFKRLCKQMGIRIDSAGSHIKLNGMYGTLDIQATWVNPPPVVYKEIVQTFPNISMDAFELIIDLKFSALLHNKWDELGWDEDAIASKPSHMIQSMHYSILDPEKPFLFWVFSSKNIGENKMFWINIDPDSQISYIREINVIREQIKLIYNSGGFVPRPEYNKCKKCPLDNNCEYQLKHPLPIRIDYTHGA